MESEDGLITLPTAHSIEDALARRHGLGRETASAVGALAQARAKLTAVAAN